MASQKDDFSKIQFAAILVFHDSREWGRDTQIIIDILRSHKGVFGTEHPPTEPLPEEQIPIYFSHGDLRKSNEQSETCEGEHTLTLRGNILPTYSVGQRSQRRKIRSRCFQTCYRERLQGRFYFRVQSFRVVPRLNRSSFLILVPSPLAHDWP